ncbi:MAG: hypothetical protein QRY71_05860 [Candidatus Rhabdochlamydia sp.]
MMNFLHLFTVSPLSFFHEKVRDPLIKLKKPLLIWIPTTLFVAAVWGKKPALKWSSCALVIYSYQSGSLSLKNLPLYAQIQRVCYLALPFFCLYSKRFPYYALPIYSLLTIYSMKKEEALSKAIIDSALALELLQQTNQEIEEQLKSVEREATLLQQSFDALLKRYPSSTEEPLSQEMHPKSLATQLSEITKLCTLASNESEVQKQLITIDEETMRLSQLRHACTLETAKISEHTEKLKTLTEKLESIVGQASEQESETKDLLNLIRQNLLSLPSVTPLTYSNPSPINAK